MVCHHLDYLWNRGKYEDYKSKIYAGECFISVQCHHRVTTFQLMEVVLSILYLTMKISIRKWASRGDKRKSRTCEKILLE